jgi:hypothetical protein
LWPSIWAHIEQNKDDTLANNISPENFERMRDRVR